MTADVIYWIWAVLLVLGNLAAWFATLLALPGNWVMVGLFALFALSYPEADFILPDASGPGVRWSTVAMIALLAGVGEVIEFAAGAAGAAKQGGSRRGMVLAVIGAMIGSIVGAILGVPVPVVGPIIAAVGGGALGAFAGAYLGETWKGRSANESIEIGTAALVGRLLGTIGKLAVGAVIVVVGALAVFVDWL